MGHCATKGPSFMSARGSIPPIIKDALDSQIGYVLMVTGKPDTGKSLFAREVFRQYEDSFLILSNAEATSADELSDTHQHQELKSGSIAYGIHLRVKELSGALSVFGVIPRTNFLAVSPLLSKGFLDYDLIPIV